LILLRANPNQCEILARCAVLTGQLTWTPPILHRGCIYVRNQSRAACIYVGKPELLPANQVRLTLADIPQDVYFDWAGQILSVEPEYAFDIPSSEWFWNWFYWSSGLLLVSLILAAAPVYWVPPERRLVTWMMGYRLLAFIAGRFRDDLDQFLDAGIRLYLASLSVHCFRTSPGDSTIPQSEENLFLERSSSLALLSGRWDIVLLAVSSPESRLRMGVPGWACGSTAAWLVGVAN